MEGEAMSWITITDDPNTLPPLDTPVFVQFKDTRFGMVVRCYNDDAEGWLWALLYEPPYIRSGKWVCDNAEFEDLDVIAWHPLPAMPEVSS